jgi:hypothetical protein
MEKLKRSKVLVNIELYKQEKHLRFSAVTHAVIESIIGTQEADELLQIDQAILNFRCSHCRVFTT